MKKENMLGLLMIILVIVNLAFAEEETPPGPRTVWTDQDTGEVYLPYVQRWSGVNINGYSIDNPHENTGDPPGGVTLWFRRNFGGSGVSSGTEGYGQSDAGLVDGITVTPSRVSQNTFDCFSNPSACGSGDFGSLGSQPGSAGAGGNSCSVQ